MRFNRVQPKQFRSNFTTKKENTIISFATPKIASIPKGFRLNNYASPSKYASSSTAFVR